MPLRLTGDGGPATRAALFNPEALTYDDAGNLYVADGGNHVVRRIAPDGIITTVFGSGARAEAPLVPSDALAIGLGRPGGPAAPGPARSRARPRAALPATARRRPASP